MRRLTCLLFALVLLAGCGGRAAPTPTVVPVPTFTPTAAAPTPSPKLDYRQVALNHVRNLAQALAALGPALQEARTTDQDWIIEIGALVAQVQLAHEALTALQPPSDMVSLHTQLTSATAKCYAATEAMTSGIDNRDSAMLQSSLTFLGECYEQLTPAVKMLQGE